MQPEDPAAVVVEIHGDFLPCRTAQIPLFQQDAQFHIFDLADHIHDILFDLNQSVHIRCDLVLQVDDLTDGVCHPGSAAIGIVGHSGHGCRTAGGEFIQ